MTNKRAKGMFFMRRLLCSIIRVPMALVLAVLLLPAFLIGDVPEFTHVIDTLLPGDKKTSL